MTSYTLPYYYIYIGLIEREWLATLATIDEEDTVYEDFVVCARRLAAELRATENVDLVVAVTHMYVRYCLHARCAVVAAAAVIVVIAFI